MHGAGAAGLRRAAGMRGAAGLRGLGVTVARSRFPFFGFHQRRRLPTLAVPALRPQPHTPAFAAPGRWVSGLSTQEEKAPAQLQLEQQDRLHASERQREVVPAPSRDEWYGRKAGSGTKTRVVTGTSVGEGEGKRQTELTNSSFAIPTVPAPSS